MAGLDEETLRRLLAAGSALVTKLDVESVLDEVLEIAADVTGARYAAIGVVDEGRTRLERFLTRGIDPAVQREIGDLPRGRGVLGVLIERPEPLRLRDVGDHPESYGFPAGHPVMRTFLGVPIVIRGEAWGNLYLTQKAGEAEFTEADQEAAVALAGWAAIAIENARLYQSEQQRGQELERAVRRLEATTAIARAVGAETDLRRVLELIVKRARALVEARALVLTLVDGDQLVVAASAGQVDARAVGARLPRATTAMGEVLHRGRAERVADVSARLALDDEGLGVAGAVTGLLVPLVHHGSQLGVLAAFDRLSEDPLFGQDDESLLGAFAASAATAVATAQSVERERLRGSIQAAERERRRWARELHDETLQGLAALRMVLTVGLRSAEPGALEDAARATIEQVGLEIANLRRLITELRPAALDELGLGPAINSLVHDAAERFGLDTRLRVDLGGDRLPPEIETTIYRVAQEALTNVIKHAQAGTVSISVERGPTAVELEVGDDGCGFDPEGPSAGFGVVGMRERAALTGGTMTVTSGEAGTTIRAVFPLGRARLAG
jgi:signal transduction histidine kinase